MGFFMSMARIGTRASVVGLGVLASLAFTTAPSWAGGGNSANAKLCEEGGYPGALLAQDGGAFKNAGQCTSYGAQGGQIAGVDVATEAFATSPLFDWFFSGFGLKPGTEAVFCTKYSPSGAQECVERFVNTDGTFAEEGGSLCTLQGSKVAFLVVEATSAAGSAFTREFPAPSGCP
jgi:hypothetical protein